MALCPLLISYLLFRGDSLSFCGLLTIKNAMTIPELPFLYQFAQAAPGGGLGQFLPIILLLGAMWFLIIAPQRKRQKAHDKMLTELKSGDEIVTSGGV